MCILATCLYHSLNILLLFGSRLSCYFSDVSLGICHFSEIWFLSIEKWYLENKVWTLVVLIASRMPTILASQGGEFTSMHPIPIQQQKFILAFPFFIFVPPFLDVRNLTGLFFFHSTPMSSADGPSLPTRLKKEKGKEKEGGH